MEIEYYDSLIGSGWENSFIVKDVFGTWDSEYSTIEKIKDYSFAGCILDADSTDKDLDNFILKALEKDANFIVIDFHLIPNLIRNSIDDYLKNNGYIDTKSYEFRLSYFRDNPV